MAISRRTGYETLIVVGRNMSECMTLFPSAIEDYARIEAYYMDFYSDQWLYDKDRWGNRKPFPARKYYTKQVIPR